MKKLLGTVRKFWLMAALVGVMSFTLAACGDDTKPAPGSTAVPATAVPTAATTNNGASFKVVLSEWSITPSTLEAPAGPITFIVSNGGTLAHNLTILGTDFKTPNFTTADGPQKLAVTLAAGTYQWECSITGHPDKGMKGTLTVK